MPISFQKSPRCFLNTATVGAEATSMAGIPVVYNSVGKEVLSNKELGRNLKSLN